MKCQMKPITVSHAPKGASDDSLQPKKRITPATNIRPEIAD